MRVYQLLLSATFCAVVVTSQRFGRVGGGTNDVKSNPSLQNGNGIQPANYQTPAWKKSPETESSKKKDGEDADVQIPDSGTDSTTKRGRTRTPSDDDFPTSSTTTL